MKSLLMRIAYGVLFAIPLMLLTYALAQASPPVDINPQDEINQGPDCKSCHPSFYETWEEGLHGQSFSDPAFQKAWQEGGEPVECLSCHVTGYDARTGNWDGEGVTCERCHNPVPDNHPQEPMPVARSADLCSECHTETYFQWQASVHRQKDLGCETCHDPHGSQLLAENDTGLCASCHKARSSDFSHTQHSQEGLACADCHMADLGEQVNQANGNKGNKDHSFFVSLDTCNGCHVYQMHDPVAVHDEESPPENLDPMASVETSSVLAAPKPVNPVGFALLAGLVGLAAGVVLAPWIERFQNKIDMRNREE